MTLPGIRTSPYSAEFPEAIISLVSCVHSSVLGEYDCAEYLTSKGNGWEWRRENSPCIAVKILALDVRRVECRHLLTKWSGSLVLISPRPLLPPLDDIYEFRFLIWEFTLIFYNRITQGTQCMWTITLQISSVIQTSVGNFLWVTKNYEILGTSSE
jgi:hypothetical protein